MSIRLEMLQVARLSRRSLGESAELSREFLLRHINSNGGFVDRVGASDLYYTVFGLGALLALEDTPISGVKSPPPAVARRPGGLPSVLSRVADYLRSFSGGDQLDLVHLCCLARCWAAISNPLSSGTPVPQLSALPGLVERFRSHDGGYNPVPRSQWGTAYGAFLALGAYQDCGLAPPEPARLAEATKSLQTPDGGFVNERLAGSPAATGTNSTAAAVTVLRNLGEPVAPVTGVWLLAQAHPQGGFRASVAAPMPDLLSTATALHALAGLGVSFAHLKELCLDFVDSLWSNEGGFHGHWADNELDCEYTFYGLLALGHLSL